MPDVDVLAVAAAALAAFVLGAAYYAVLGPQLAAARGEAAAEAPQPPWKLGVELLRCLVLAAVVAGLAVEASVDGAAGGLALGLALWVGFPLVLWSGAMLWEGTYRRFAALHAGDWLLKLLAIGAIAAMWQ